ncbi:hypothetical protein [uncultured Helicobacter sp.]|uniref:hypothetical protein n=1 Tax=uncultured Helicobacter sp. TaxID=175537 RepID=UPI0026268D08|nr:hypothetical protein [uncultured Helicobacter sp.]
MEFENNKDKTLKEIVISLCSKEIKDEQELQERLKELKDIYEDKDYRHRYDEITAAILSNNPNLPNDNAGEKDSLMNVSQNMRFIYEMASQNKDMDKEILKKIEKLFVHTNLECVRLRSLKDNFNRVGEKIKDYDEKMKDIKQKEKEIKENLEKQQTQYIVILGIFASIVLAFVGGLTFSTSVLAHIHQASIYRLIFVISFIALFIGNILYYLFDFLSKIALKQKEEISFFKRPIFYFNIIILLIMLGISAVYLYKKCILSHLHFTA